MLNVERSPLLECAMDSMEDVFLAFSPENALLTWNQSLEESTGFAPEEIEEFRPDDLLVARDSGPIGERIETIVRDGNGRFKAHLQTKHGALLPYEFTGSLFRRNGQRVVCLVGRSVAEAGNVHRPRDDEAGRSTNVSADQDAEEVRQTRKKNRLLRLMKEVTTNCNEAEDLDDALEGAIEAVCRHGGWQVGHVYLPTESRFKDFPSEGNSGASPSPQLVPTLIWNCDRDDRFGAFRDATDTRRFVPGEGLPGQVFATGAPVWIENVREEDSFVRGQAATADGLKGAVAIPVPSGDGIAAVLEFFTEEIAPYDQELLEVMESIGVQIGRVAEREEVRRRLRSSLEQLQSLKESTADGIVLADEELRITDWNRGATEIFGYEKDEIIGRSLDVLLPEGDYNLPLTRAERADRPLEDLDLEEAVDVVGRRKDGEQFPLDLSLSHWEIDGKTYFGAIFRDVTERREREDELRQSERRYRRLFEEAKEGIAMITANGRIHDANPAAAAILGYDQDTLRAMNVAELFVEPDEWKAVAEQLFEEGALLSRELRLERADGEPIICRMSTTLLRSPDGEIEGCQTFFQDVTEWRQTKEALKESEEMFRHLSERALIGIGLIQEGTYTYVNPALSNITGYSPQELLGESPKLFIHPDDWPKAQSYIRRRLEGEIEDAHYETRIHTKSGETRYVEVSGTRIDYRGKPAAISTVQDVTEQRRLQREMIQVQEEERKRLGQELHDSLSSQLTGANMKLSFLSEKVKGGLSKNEASGEEIAEGMREVQALIKESASDVRRLSHGLNPAGLPEGDLLSALKGLVSNIKTADLERESSDRESGRLPLEESPLDEEAATHLYRIAQEAVNNARKYADASNIVIRLRDEGGALVIEVEDNGTGFDPAEVGEEGLGLRSMRRRAELLNGDLTVESSPDDGTVVRCRLPV